MHCRFNAVLLMFGAVSLCIIWAFAAKTQTNVVKPLGPRMCDLFCRRTFGCSKYIYMIDHMLCRLTDVDLKKEDPAKGRYVVKSIKGPKHVERKQEKLSRLLMFPTGGSPQTAAKQLFLHNMSIVSCPYLVVGSCRAAAYISASKTLAIAIFNRLHLYSHNDYQIKKTIKDVYISGITVDDFKHIVFLGSYARRRALYNMTMEGNNLKPVCSLPYTPIDIASDPKRSHIYVMFPRIIAKFAYSGSNLGDVAEGRVKPFMFVDFERDILHYMIGKPAVVKQRSMKNGKVKAIQLGLKATTCFHVFGKTFYVMPAPFEGKLIIISENGKKKEIETNFDEVSVKMLYFADIP